MTRVQPTDSGAEPECPTTEIDAPADSTPKAKRAWLTYAACAVTVFVSLGISTEAGPHDWDLYAAYGAPPASEIWNGAYWGLITSVFVHVAPWHLAFNVYWLWVLGAALERRIRSLQWLLFFLSAATVSSGIQLAFSGQTGIGMSGVVYGIFGVLWIAGFRDSTSKRLISRQTILVFLAWMILCIILSVLNVWEVGNAAHVSGLLFGAAIGLVRSDEPGRMRLGLFAVVTLFVASLVPIWWSPWSFHWVAQKGYDAHARKDYEEAIRYYRRSLELSADQPVWLLENLALAYYDSGRRREFTDTLLRLHRLDPKAAAELEREILGADNPR